MGKTSNIPPRTQTHIAKLPPEIMDRIQNYLPSEEANKFRGKFSNCPTFSAGERHRRVNKIISDDENYMENITKKDINDHDRLMKGMSRLKIKCLGTGALLISGLGLFAIGLSIGHGPFFLPAITTGPLLVMAGGMPTLLSFMLYIAIRYHDVKNNSYTPVEKKY